MLILTVIDIIYGIVSSVTGVVFPAIPQQIDSILIYILQMIDNGLDIVYTMFVDASIIGPLVLWVIDTQIILLGIDLGWRIFDTVRLRRNPS